MTKAGTYGGTLTAKPQGDKLRLLRKALNMKQGEIETATDISHGQLTRYENGLPASVRDLIKLAEYYGVSPKELVSDEGLQTTSPILIDLAKLHGVRIERRPYGQIAGDEDGKRTEAPPPPVNVAETQESSA